MRVEMSSKTTVLPISGLETNHDRALPPRPLGTSRNAHLEFENEQLRKHNEVLRAEVKHLIIENESKRDELLYYKEKDRQSETFRKNIRKGLQIIQSAMSGPAKAKREASKKWKEACEERGGIMKLGILKEEDEDIRVFVDRNMI
jgi:hypothetical protein